MHKSLLQSLTQRAASTVDRLATFAAVQSNRRSQGAPRSPQLSHPERVESLTEMLRVYQGRFEAGGGAAYFQGARPIQPIAKQVRQLFPERSLQRGQASDLVWRSDYSCFLPELGARYTKYQSNQLAGARWYRHTAGEPRPTILLIHGYLGGNYSLEERAWPVLSLYEQGLDVVLCVLPFHGVRKELNRKGPPPFPSSDPRFTNEGLRQAMHDLLSLMAWLKSQGSPQIGVMGMSLGGYSASLLATLEPELAFAIPVIPLGSLAEFAREQGRLGQNPAEQLKEYELLDQVHRCVSPLHRAPVISSKQILVIGAEADRITPLQHARRLAQHFNATLDTWQGGHLLQVGRGQAFRRAVSFIRELGVL